MQLPTIFGNSFSRMTLGLEIGSSSVKAVWVRPASGRVEIVDFAIEDLNGDTGDLSGPLDRIVRKGKAPCRRTVAVFSGMGVFEGASFLPPMPDKELAEFLRMTLLEKGSLNLSEPVIKFIISRVKPAGKKRAVITLAADSSTWKNLLEQVNRSRVCPTSLIFSPEAYESIIPPDKNILLIDIGARMTLFYLYRDGELAFIRWEAVLGSDDLNRDMTMEIVTPGGTVHLTPEQAEDIKQKFGIPSPDRMQDEVHGIELNEIWSMLRPWCDRLAAAIKDSIIFYHQHYGPGRIKTVYLTGGGSLLPRLPEYLTENCNHKVSLLPTPDRFDWASEELREDFVRDYPRLQLAMGAALGGEDKTNLLPLKNIVSRKLLLPLRILWIVLPFFAIALGALGLITAKQVRLSTVREKQLSGVLSSRQVEAENWHRIYSKEKEVSQARQYIRRFRRYPDLWIGVFWQISRLLPDRIILDRLIMEHTGLVGFLTFEGTVIAGKRAHAARKRPEQILTSFTRELRESPFFSAARNLEAGEDEAGVFRFVFTVLLQREEEE
ncbi:MAG: pilus assembly protein PilM [Candidatus Auribacterota bacterium]|nr:pilus assembly protein PilM [Candidatus Auribacterota bacterium]